MIEQTHQIDSDRTGTQQNNHQSERCHSSYLLWNFCSICIINRTIPEELVEVRITVDGITERTFEIA